MVANSRLQNEEETGRPSLETRATGPLLPLADTSGLGVKVLVESLDSVLLMVWPLVETEGSESEKNILPVPVEPVLTGRNALMFL